MGKRHLTRREVLDSIALLGAGSLLLPVGALETGFADTRPTGVIRGALRDRASGQPVPAKVRVSSIESGETLFPAGAIKTMPKRAPKRFFYARGSYEIAVPPGMYQIEVARGLCHESLTEFVTVTAGITRVIDFSIPALLDARRSGWFSANTHTHYHLDIEEDPDDRLRIVPPAEALDISVLSYAVRNELPYPSNKYAVGRLPQFSRDGCLIDMGQETRNDAGPLSAGYGHCLFMNLPHVVEPVSTGVLSRAARSYTPEGKAPDFPTVSMLAAEARRLGGLTLWCHNGGGMEMAVAVALGHVDAFNVADGQEAIYERYYRLLDCGIRLPLSTGTDWWIYDHNRVFAAVEGQFSYESWIAALRAGRSFVTNGPLLFLTVDGRSPGATLRTPGPYKVEARALSRVPFERIELVVNGAVVAEQSAVGGREARLEREIRVEGGGWIAARAAGAAKTYAGFVVFAHTSPVYVQAEGAGLRRRAETAGTFVDEIEESMRVIRKTYKFASDADKAIALGRFEEGRQFYARVVAGKP
jgi:hypothetical protein